MDLGLEDRNGGAVSAELSPQVVRGGRIVGLQGPGEAAGRFRRPSRPHVLVDLARAAASILVPPEVDVVLALHRLDSEATANLHAILKELPLLKGNHGVGET